MNKISEVTLIMIEEMQHCIGFDENRVTGIKNRIMHAYRNHFCDINTNKNWIKLIDLGLAKQDLTSDENGITYFRLTKKGFNFLAKLCGFEKIIMQHNKNDDRG